MILVIEEEYRRLLSESYTKNTIVFILIIKNVNGVSPFSSYVHINFG